MAKPTRSQLITLACASGLPFVGFGFADNFIMILVGDYIDATLGVAFGLSTMAAAGFGNLISDVVGISLGEVIEAQVAKVLTAPPLSFEQLQLRTTRLVKGSANAMGITIGCLLGMAPLLWKEDRKAVFFNDDELDVYHSSFAPYGVSPQQFFDLLRHGKWRTAEAGTVLVRQGGSLDSTMFLHNGSALGTVHDYDPEGGSGSGRGSMVTAVYEGRAEPMETKEELAHMTRGCIIGGTALVDAAVVGKPYPNTVTVTVRKAPPLQTNGRCTPRSVLPQTPTPHSTMTPQLLPCCARPPPHICIPQPSPPHISVRAACLPAPLPLLRSGPASFSSGRPRSFGRR